MSFAFVTNREGNIMETHKARKVKFINRKLPKRHTTKEDAVKAVYGFAAKDTVKFCIDRIYVEGDKLVATDGKWLLVLEGDWGKDGMYHVSKDGELLPDTVGGTYPKYQDVIPERDAEFEYELDLKDTIEYLCQIIPMAIRPDDTAPIDVVYNTDGSIGFGCNNQKDVVVAKINILKKFIFLGSVDAVKLLRLLEWHYAVGGEKVTFQWVQKNKPILMATGTPLEATSILMRMKSSKTLELKCYEEA